MPTCCFLQVEDLRHASEPSRATSDGGHSGRKLIHARGPIRGRGPICERRLLRRVARVAHRVTLADWGKHAGRSVPFDHTVPQARDLGHIRGSDGPPAACARHLSPRLLHPRLQANLAERVAAAELEAGRAVVVEADRTHPVGVQAITAVGRRWLLISSRLCRVIHRPHLVFDHRVTRRPAWLDAACSERRSSCCCAADSVSCAPQMRQPSS